MLLVENAFNILGLDTSASLTQIDQRYRYLLVLSKIEEIETFEFDIANPSRLRTPEKVRASFDALYNVEEKLIASLLWFEQENVHHTNFIKLLAEQKYADAISYGYHINDWIGQKNLALALMLRGAKDCNITSLKEGLAIYGYLLKSSEFIAFYKAHYKLHDDAEISDDLMDKMHDMAKDALAMVVIDLYKCDENIAPLLAEYEKIFGNNDKIDGVLESLFVDVDIAINNLRIEPLEKTLEKDADVALLEAISEFDAEKFRVLRVKLEEKLGNIHALGFKNNSLIETRYDQFAEKLRSQVLTLGQCIIDADIILKLGICSSAQDSATVNAKKNMEALVTACMDMLQLSSRLSLLDRERLKRNTEDGTALRNILVRYQKKQENNHKSDEPNCGAAGSAGKKVQDDQQGDGFVRNKLSEIMTRNAVIAGAIGSSIGVVAFYNASWLFVIVGMCVLCYAYSSYRWIDNYRSSPHFRSFSGLDNDLEAKIDREASECLVRESGFYLTRSFLIVSSFFGLQVKHLKDVVWVYQLTIKTKHSFNCIPCGSTHSHNVIVADRYGAMWEIQAFSEKSTKEILQTLISFIPWAVVGYDEKFDYEYTNARNSFVAEVDRRRKYWRPAD